MTEAELERHRRVMNRGFQAIAFVTGMSVGFAIFIWIQVFTG